MRTRVRGSVGPLLSEARVEAKTFTREMGLPPHQPRPEPWGTIEIDEALSVHLGVFVGDNVELRIYTTPEGEITVNLYTPSGPSDLRYRLQR